MFGDFHAPDPDGIETGAGSSNVVAKALPRAPQNNNVKDPDDPGKNVGLSSVPKDKASTGGSSKPRGIS